APPAAPPPPRGPRRPPRAPYFCVLPPSVPATGLTLAVAGAGAVRRYGRFPPGRPQLRHQRRPAVPRVVVRREERLDPQFLRGDVDGRADGRDHGEEPHLGAVDVEVE